jgi:hypothetical protein
LSLQTHQTVPVRWKVLVFPDSSDCPCTVESPCLSRLIRLSLYSGRSLSLQTHLTVPVRWKVLVFPDSSDCPCMVECPRLSKAHQTVPVQYGRRSLSLQSFIRMSLYGWNGLISPELIRMSLFGGRSLSLQSSADCPFMLEGPCLSRAHQTVPVWWKILVSPALIRLSLYG